MSALRDRHLAAGATLASTGGPVSYGDPLAGVRAFGASAVVGDLSSRARIAIRGPDALRFANGLFTQNFRSATPGTSTRTAWCDDRGRMLGAADALVLDAETLWLALEGTTSAAFCEHFAPIAMFDDLVLEPLVGVTLITLQGAGAADIAAPAHLCVPPPGRAEERGAWCAARDRFGAPGVDLWVPDDDAGGVWSRLVGSGAVPVGDDVLRVLRVRAGQPEWPVDMTDKQLVAELGLRDAMLAFDKGCYVGQETINRLDVRGQARRGLCVVRLASDAASSGDVIQHDGAAVGRVTSPVVCPLAGPLGLAVVRKPLDLASCEVAVVTGTGVVAGDLNPVLALT